MNRAFRFQTGEMDKILDSIKQRKTADVDIDVTTEIDQVIADLKGQNIILNEDIAYDYKAVDTVKYEDFYVRIAFKNHNDDIYVDFYLVDQKEDDYAEIGWG